MTLRRGETVKRIPTSDGPRRSTGMRSRFTATLRRPADAQSDCRAFVMFPKAVSDRLPRRGRTSVEGTVNGRAFLATLEPDGLQGHWMRLDDEFMTALGIRVGDKLVFDVAPVEHEPEPEVPTDLRAALAASPAASAAWNDTTTIARVDWIHWITTAKQARTREQRIANACNMLASGKRRVCCFDPSGFYSKAFSAPLEATERKVSTPTKRRARSVRSTK